MEFVEPCGTWTTTVRANPFTVGDSVVDPGDVVPHPGTLVAAELTRARPLSFSAHKMRTTTLAITIPWIRLR